MWLALASVVVATAAFLTGWWAGTMSSRSTMTAAKVLWGAAESRTSFEQASRSLIEEANRSAKETAERAQSAASGILRSVETLEQINKRTTDQVAHMGQAVEALSTRVSSLDERTGLVFEAMNAGLVLKRGQLQEQVSAGMELRTASNLRASRGIASTSPDDGPI